MYLRHTTAPIPYSHWAHAAYIQTLAYVQQNDFNINTLISPYHPPNCACLRYYIQDNFRTQLLPPPPTQFLRSLSPFQLSIFHFQFSTFNFQRNFFFFSLSSVKNPTITIVPFDIVSFVVINIRRINFVLARQCLANSHPLRVLKTLRNQMSI